METREKAMGLELSGNKCLCVLWFPKTLTRISCPLTPLGERRAHQIRLFIYWSQYLPGVGRRGGAGRGDTLCGGGSLRCAVLSKSVWRGALKTPGELGLAELTVFKGAVKCLAGSVLSDLIY